MIANYFSVSLYSLVLYIIQQLNTYILTGAQNASEVNSFLILDNTINIMMAKIMFAQIVILAIATTTVLTFGYISPAIVIVHIIKVNPQMSTKSSLKTVNKLF